jgi:hypothetical protein
VTVVGKDHRLGREGRIDVGRPVLLGHVLVRHVGMGPTVTLEVLGERVDAAPVLVEEDGVAAANLDETTVDAAIAQVSAAAATVHDASTDALNELHAVLTPPAIDDLPDTLAPDDSNWSQVFSASDKDDSNWSQVFSASDKFVTIQ